MSTEQIWRDPPTESANLYPGLVVHDHRVTGSITAGASRVPLWAFAYTAVVHGFEDAESDYSLNDYGLTADMFGSFVTNLFEMRGEFGRLLLVLADAERRERESGPAWWDKKKDRARVSAQLRRCLACLETVAPVGEKKDGEK